MAGFSTALCAQYLDKLTAGLPKQEHSSTSKDFSRLIQDEVSDLKAKKGKLFEWHKTNINGLLYLSLTSEAGGYDMHTVLLPVMLCLAVLTVAVCTEAVDPVDLVLRVARDVQTTKQCKSRHAAECHDPCVAPAFVTNVQFVKPDTGTQVSSSQAADCVCRLCIRFVPIETVCPANLGEIKKAAASLCERAFPAGAGAEPLKFAVQYEHRASVKLQRGDVIDAVVAGVPQVCCLPRLCLCVYKF